MSGDFDATQVLSKAFNPALDAIRVDGSGVSGLVNFSYDYVSMALSGGNAVETYTFKTGGAGGTTSGTIVVTYTDGTRNILSSVVRL